LIRKVRKNMKLIQHTLFDQALLKRPFMIEITFDELKILCRIGYARHRSPANFIINLMSGIVA
jgi:hypothetical protein